MALMDAHPAAIGEKNRRGCLPLHVAAIFNASKAVVVALLEAHPEASKIKDNDKYLPLHCAIKCKASEEVVRVLLDAHPDAIGEENNKGFGQSCIEETIINLGMVHNIIEKYLTKYDEDAIKSKRKLLRNIFNKSLSSDGSPILHLASAQNSEEAFTFCRYLVEVIGVDFEKMVDGHDLTARNIAQGNPMMSKWAKSVGTFLGRYFIERRDMYESKTCTVHFAIDVNKAKGDEQRNVVIKIMENKVQFQRELKQRLRGGIYHPGVDIDQHVNLFDWDHTVLLAKTLITAVYTFVFGL